MGYSKSGLFYHHKFCYPGLIFVFSFYDTQAPFFPQILRQMSSLAQGFSFTVHCTKHFHIGKESYLAFTCKVNSISVDSCPLGCSWGHWLVVSNWKLQGSLGSLLNAPLKWFEGQLGQMNHKVAFICTCMVF